MKSEKKKIQYKKSRLQSAEMHLVKFQESNDSFSKSLEPAVYIKSKIHYSRSDARHLSHTFKKTKPQRARQYSGKREKTAAAQSSQSAGKSLTRSRAHPHRNIKPPPPPAQHIYTPRLSQTIIFTQRSGQKKKNKKPAAVEKEKARARISSFSQQRRKLLFSSPLS